MVDTQPTIPFLDLKAQYKTILKGFTAGVDGDTVTEMSMMLLKARGGICVDKGFSFILYGWPRTSRLIVLGLNYCEVGGQAVVGFELDLHAGGNGVLNGFNNSLVSQNMKVGAFPPLTIRLLWDAGGLRRVIQRVEVAE